MIAMRDFQNYYNNDYYTEWDHRCACWANNYRGWCKAKKQWRKIGKRRMKSDVNCLIDKYLNEEVK